MSATDLNNISKRAHAVREMDGRMLSAFDESHASAAELLSAIIEAIGPALDALSSRVRIDNVNTRTDRGVWLAGARAEPHSNGEGAYLMEDGSLVRVRVRGGHGDGEFAAEFSRLTCDEFAEEWDVETTASYLSRLLDQQLEGNRARRTMEADRRARKLRALAELLRTEK